MVGGKVEDGAEAVVTGDLVVDGKEEGFEGSAAGMDAAATQLLGQPRTSSRRVREWS